MAGPNVIQSEEHIFKMCRQIKQVTDSVGVKLIFKSSFDKANRTSAKSFRGPGIDEGLKVSFIIIFRQSPPHPRISLKQSHRDAAHANVTPSRLRACALLTTDSSSRQDHLRRPHRDGHPRRLPGGARRVSALFYTFFCVPAFSFSTCAVLSSFC
jgi:hypothetical protein